MRKRVALLALVLAALVSPPVSAEEVGTDASPTATAVAGDDSVEVTGVGCPPGAAVDYSWVFNIFGTRTSPPPIETSSTTADGAGGFGFTITDLSDEGSWTITLECGGGRTELVVDLATGGTTPTTVATPTVDASAAPGALPRTGSGTTRALVVIGVAALTVGGVATRAATRR